jgi:hypothetical protein
MTHESGRICQHRRTGVTVAAATGPRGPMRGKMTRTTAQNLFRVPQARCVGFVPPFAPTGRMAVTGWLRRR